MPRRFRVRKRGRPIRTLASAAGGRGGGGTTLMTAPPIVLELDTSGGIFSEAEVTRLSEEKFGKRFCSANNKIFLIIVGTVINLLGLVDSIILMTLSAVGGRREITLVAPK